MPEPGREEPGPAGAGRALFLDFDGTLVDIADRPEAVVVEPELPGILTGLKRHLAGALAIVTGRPVSDVDRFIPPDLGLDVCGLHGLESRVGGHLSPPSGLADLRQEIAALRERLAGHPGLLVEDKRVGVAVHWRMAPDAEADAAAAIAELAARLGPAYRIQDGKAVRELVPAGAGKGEGIRALLGAPPYLGRCPVFIGDDRTDEHGFEAVNELGGLSIKVGPGPTQARRRILSSGSCRLWLAAWRDSGTMPNGLAPG